MTKGGKLKLAKISVAGMSTVSNTNQQSTPNAAGNKGTKLGGSKKSGGNSGPSNK